MRRPGPWAPARRSGRSRHPSPAPARRRNRWWSGSTFWRARLPATDSRRSPRRGGDRRRRAPAPGSRPSRPRRSSGLRRRCARPRPTPWPARAVSAPCCGLEAEPQSRRRTRRLGVSHGLDQQGLALVRLDAADHDDLVAIAVMAEALGLVDRRIERGGLDAVELHQPVGDDLAVGEDRAASLMVAGVEVDQALSHGDVLRRLLDADRGRPTGRSRRGCGG
jgi:hypothetical protein